MKLNALTVGTGPRHVVFLHGLFGQGKNWGSIATALADIATCHLVDLPNHGLSPWTEEFDLDEQADLVAGWLRENVPTPVVLIGHSLGGKIAMRLALRHQGLVDRLMVVDEKGHIVGCDHLTAFLAAWFLRKAGKNSGHAIARDERQRAHAARLQITEFAL